jgi:hypothetical protein
LDIPIIIGPDPLIDNNPENPELEQEEGLDGKIPLSMAEHCPRTVTSPLDLRVASTLIVGNAYADDEADASADPAGGHRRLLKGSKNWDDAPDGFRVMDRCLQMYPQDQIDPIKFGVNVRAAIPNSTGVWPQRYSWHSEDLCAAVHVFSPEVMLYILHAQEEWFKPNDPGSVSYEVY